MSCLYGFMDWGGNRDLDSVYEKNHLMSLLITKQVTLLISARYCELSDMWWDVKHFSDSFWHFMMVEADNGISDPCVLWRWWCVAGMGTYRPKDEYNNIICGQSGLSDWLQLCVICFDWTQYLINNIPWQKNMFLEFEKACIPCWQ